MDWETWLRTASKRPSDHEDAKRDTTEQQIRDALSAYKPLAGRYHLYVKGSYANNTNVRLNFDVDVAVEYTGYFYSELCFNLKGHDKSEVGVVSSDDPYTREDFKRDIETALSNAFGKEAVEVGRIAIRVRQDKTTLPADVVPSWEYRRYDGIAANGEPILFIGSRVYPSSGPYVNNFPKIQVLEGTKKNDETGRRYKRMVRCLKKLQTRLVDSGKLSEELPSYLIECLVYNVPSSSFGSDSYLTDFRAVLAFLWNGTLEADGGCADWLEVHRLHYLFKGNRSWTFSQVHELVDTAWDEVGIS